MVTVVVYIAAPGLTETKWVESSLSVETGRWTEQKPRLTQSVLGSLQVPLIQIARWFNISFQLSHSVLCVKMDHQASCLNPLLQWFPSRWWLACLVAICSTWWTKCQTTSGSRLRTATRPPREPSLENLLLPWFRSPFFSTFGRLEFMTFSRTVVLDGWSWVILKEGMFLERLMSLLGKRLVSFSFCLPCLCFLFKV